MPIALTIILLAVGIGGIVMMPFIADFFKQKQIEKAEKEIEIPEGTKVTNLTRDKKEGA